VDAFAGGGDAGGGEVGGGAGGVPSGARAGLARIARMGKLPSLLR